MWQFKHRAGFDLQHTLGAAGRNVGTGPTSFFNWLLSYFLSFEKVEGMSRQVSRRHLVKCGISILTLPRMDAMASSSHANDFNPEQWGRLQNVIVAHDDWTPTAVVGPRDALGVLAIREEYRRRGLDWGEGIPADVFLLSPGEPEDRAATKFGGLPFFSKNDKWPESRETKAHLSFLAQISFANSKDIVQEDLPGDVLLVFGDISSKRRRPEFHLEWMNTKTDRRHLVTETLGDMVSSPFFGVRWRTESYKTPLDNILSTVSNQLSLSDLEMVSSLFATQICKRPFAFGRNIEGKVLCAFGIAKPTTMDSFPFLGVEEPKWFGYSEPRFEPIYDDSYDYFKSWSPRGEAALLVTQDSGSFQCQLVFS